MLVCYLMENIVLSYVVFFFLVLVWAGAILPFVRRWSDTLDVPQPTGVLSVCLGIGLGLLSFSIVARFFTNYALAFPLSVLAVWALGFLAQKNLFQSETKPKEFWNKPNKAFTAFFLILFFALIAWRFYFPNVEVISENMGGEKLYNFQYQQAFVFGHGYPPEHLWYLGSKINYYILPKALPGLTSHFMASLFNLPMTGGVTFVLGDVFFIALGCAAVGAFAFTAMSLISSAESKLRLPMSVVLASFPMLVAPARAFSQVFNGNIDFWSLSRIIPDTINEYPLWNFAFADNHAHSNAIFLQVSFWAVFTALLFYKGARNSVFSVLSGLLLGALLYSNTHSVMISAALFAPVTLYLLFKDCWQTKNYSLLKYLLEFVFVFGAVTWPVQTGDRPDTMLYLVPSEMTSTVMDFLNVQFIIFAALVFLFACMQKTTPIFSTQEIKSRKELKVLAAIAIVSAVLGYPVVGLCLIVAAVLLSSGHEKNIMTASLAASGTLMLWIVPEIVGMNLDYGNEFMRVNTVFKFYFEAIYAVPLFLVLAFWKQFDTQALATLLKKLRPVMVLCVLLIVFVQWKSAWARIHKSADEPSLDGMAYFKKDFPIDFEIANYLANLKQSSIVAEECGVPPKLTGYFPAGRISALSAKRGLCGWGHHVTLYHKQVGLAGFRGENNVNHITKRERWIQTLLDVNLPNRAAYIPDAVAGLKSLGVTHFVVGQLEKAIHPNASVTEIAKHLGNIVIQHEDFGLIELR